ncbi:hypothetical protein ACUH7Y_02185 [Clostridium beijerinckii]|uniref:Uncharacterized protein n=1 Tax=Clostridium beijerinckii TaxID=1520 RepID=A0A7X9XRY7_CLOBE|nr:hypothetical protein [Clostridium beijerinckii]NMF07938.1 hypothetical protein [Clostridium beijerinckii]
MLIIIIMFFLITSLAIYYKLCKYLLFIDKFINVEEIDFEDLDQDKYEILFCTKEQLQIKCGLILKFYTDNISNLNTKELKILGNEKSFNSGKCIRFFEKYEIDHIPNILIIENGIKKDYIILTSGD